MFHILVVDDDPNMMRLLLHVMKNLRHPHEVHFARDGIEALDFLQRRGPHGGAPRPNIILLDLNMPRLTGLETLCVLKNDPELRVIPVIVISSLNSPQDVLECYEAHANCFVEKPMDVERSAKLLLAVEAFWMDFALLPGGVRQIGDRFPRRVVAAKEMDSGQGIAGEMAEARSQAMRTEPTPMMQWASATRSSGCEEHNHLLQEFGAAVHELMGLHEQQFRAILDGDTESYRFDLLIHMANEKKQRAKYSYLRHVETHGCLVDKCY